MRIAVILALNGGWVDRWGCFPLRPEGIGEESFLDLEDLVSRMPLPEKSSRYCPARGYEAS